MSSTENVGGHGVARVRGYLLVQRRNVVHVFNLDRSVNPFRFIGFLFWFVLGPGGIRKGLPGPPGAPGQQKIKAYTFCRAPLSGRAMLATLCLDGSTLCYTIMLPGRKSAFWAGFWPECYRENIENRPSDWSEADLVFSR